MIAAATVVATTLTRAYKRESITARRFDTVILDEASMAPIPALLAAAALAESNVVIVGDPKALRRAIANTTVTRRHTRLAERLRNVV